MLKFIQNNREITALLAVVLLFVLPGFSRPSVFKCANADHGL
ncbi:Autoinducer 2 import system permease protein lsrC [Escherichia coli]|uniref:Autoinducer 2 import system permease protein lsrC n=1 Tax=Escherichia coli TaxID=562 RepID=A0A376LP27_ECOLX|nr:Autoinducer 2 import system permease protein lsrC [Escherichia coli]